MTIERNNVWEEVAETIQIIAEQLLGRNRERIMDKDILWRNNEVQKVISRKKKKFKEWQLTKRI